MVEIGLLALPAVTQHLVGVHEIAELLGVSRQRVDQLANDDPRFPEPVAVLAAGRVWERADVERWARESGRLE